MSKVVKRTYDGGDGPRTVSVSEHAGGLKTVVDGEEIPFHARRIRAVEGGVDLVIGTDHGVERAVVVRDGAAVYVHLHGRVHRLRIVTARSEAVDHPQDNDPFAASPMTGVLMKVHVAPGDTVAAGSALFVVEAMKMEFVVEAPRDVIVDRVDGEAGASVDIGQVVVTFRDTESESASAEPLQ